MSGCCEDYTKLTPASPRQHHVYCPYCGKKLERICCMCGKPVRLQEASVCYTVNENLYAHPECADRLILAAKRHKEELCKTKNATHSSKD